MTQFDIATVITDPACFRRMNSAALFLHPAHHLIKNSLHDLMLTLRIEACHKRPHQTIGRGAADHSGFLQQYGFRSASAAGNGSNHAGTTASADDDLCLFHTFDRSLINLHISLIHLLSDELTLMHHRCGAPLRMNAGYFNSTSISISQAIPPGSVLTPIADLAGRPISSPKRSLKNSEPPFTT